MNVGLWGFLAILALVFEVVFATGAFVYTKRLLSRDPLPLSDDVGSFRAVLRKLRKDEPMADDELDLANQVIGDRRSFLAYCIPAAFFTMGCFYIFGSLEHLHGATPSERTFLGVIPMITSTNLVIQMRKSARLKGRLKKRSTSSARPQDETVPTTRTG